VSAHGSSLGVEGNALFPVLFLVHFSLLFEDFYFSCSFVVTEFCGYRHILPFSFCFFRFACLCFFSFCFRCSASFVIILV